MYCDEYSKSKIPASHFCFIGKYRNTDKCCEFAGTDNQGFTYCRKGFEGTEKDFFKWYYESLIDLKEESK